MKNLEALVKKLNHMRLTDLYNALLKADTIRARNMLIDQINGYMDALTDIGTITSNERVEIFTELLYYM